MGEYSYNDVSKANHEKLIRTLAAKYNIDIPAGNESFYIQDENDSLIYFENNGFSISIQYINIRESYINNIWDTYFKNAIKRDSLSADAGPREMLSIL